MRPGVLQTTSEPKQGIMAIVYPKDIFEPYSFGTAVLPYSHFHELNTLRRLRDELPDHYTVFHSTHVAWWNGKRAHFAEADFVVVNRDGDVLMIEQKNGRLSETGAALVKNYDDGDRNIVDQMNRCADSLRTAFSQANDDSLALRMLLYCPDHTLVGLNSVGLPRELVVDRSRASQLSNIVENALPKGSGGAKTAARRQRVLEFLSNRYELKVTKEQLMELHKVNADRLTGGLLDALRRFDMAPLRLRIAGTAGCGKTEIARDYVQAWAAQGRRTLLVCFNNALAAVLKERLGGQAHVATLLGFCRAFMESRGVTVDFRQVSRPGFWSAFLEQMQALVLTDPPRGEWLFDTLIVDEGQDFESDQFQILRFFLPEDGDIVWLEDPQQNLYLKHPFQEPGFVTFRADGNFRTPLRVARFIQSALNIPFVPLNPVPGEGVHVFEYGSDAQQLATLTKRIERFVSRGYSPDQLVVLSARRLEDAIFQKAEQLGPLRIKRFSGYDADGRLTYTSGELLCDSIWRFKGLEAPIVILTDVAPQMDRNDSTTLAEHAQRVLYCGMTRATWRLELLVSKASPACDTFARLASGTT